MMAGVGITVVDWDDTPFICQPLPLTPVWTKHEFHLTVPSWLPATVSAAFIVDGALTLWLDDVELRQEVREETPFSTRF
jgi:hypothetical protein|eukprot:COSAG06_NODE_409_length_16096_cov_27.922548_9_plen_79_part_00